MKIYAGFDEHGKINCISTMRSDVAPTALDNEALEIHLEGFFVENGALKYSKERYEQHLFELEKEEAIKRAVSKIEEIKAREQLRNLDDEDAVLVAVLFPSWKAGMSLKPGDRFNYEGSLYKAVQPNTTQDDWRPDALPALYEKLGD